MAGKPITTQPQQRSAPALRAEKLDEGCNRLIKWQPCVHVVEMPKIQVDQWRPLEQRHLEETVATAVDAFEWFGDAGSSLFGRFGASLTTVQSFLLSSSRKSATIFCTS
jgi:hypothetical protein